MSFTITVEEIEDNKETKNINDLELFHGECYNAKIEVTEISNGIWSEEMPAEDWLAFICTRCKTRVWVNLKRNPNLNIFKTAIDGKKRRVVDTEYPCNGLYDKILSDYDPNKMLNCNDDLDVCVTQKKLNKLFCTYCGGQLTQEVTYCHFCGTPFS